MVYTFEKYNKPTVKEKHLKLGGTSPDHRNISVTSSCIMRDHDPWIGVMGEFHFSRCERSRWHRELCIMKAGGVSIVSTYLFWIYHEEKKGEFDFTGDRDIRAFVLEAARVGLEVVLRIGPWAHGECRNGGFPDWLCETGWELRRDDPRYLACVYDWYQMIYNEVNGLFYKDGGPIIGIQLENELVNDARHLLSLKRIAEKIGFRVPLWTVTGWNSRYGAKIPLGEVLPVFGGYPDAPWAKGKSPLPPSPNFAFCRVPNDTAIGSDVVSATPERVSEMRDRDGWRLPYEDYPFATCELGGGIEVTHHRRPIIDPLDIYALSLVKLGSGNNLIGYYMYHGGTNKIGRYSTLNESRATGYPNDYAILSYDFQAPISEFGEIRPHYGMLNMLHLFVEDFGDVLAPMTPVGSRYAVAADDAVSLRYAMRTDGKGGFIFVNRHVRGLKTEDIENVEFEAMGVRFPPVTVRADQAFFFPFRMSLGYKVTLEYATAQPLCRTGKTYFFAAIPGIVPEYKFSDGASHTVTKSGADIAVIKTGETDVRIITLPWKEACFLRRIRAGGAYRLVIGEGCNIYGDNEVLTADREWDFAYREWCVDKFVRRSESYEIKLATLTKEPVKEPFPPKYAEELSIGGSRAVTWFRLEVDSPNGMVEIDDECDAAQIYADGELVADQYYIGVPWRVPARMLYGRECYLCFSELRDDFYREF